MKSSPLIRASLELLGVSAGASPADLKKAYHRLALLYHPDRNPSVDAAREFQKISEAFELLCDEARMHDANRDYFRERLLKPVFLIEGLEITFGSFFGYRLFNPARAMGRSGAALLTGRGGAGSSEDWGVFEESNSVLDHAAYDSLEAVYAGRFSVEDESLFMGELRTGELQRLPWVLLNNQGILSFMSGDVRSAKRSYTELCARVPNNILFTYRLGLCHIVLAFQKRRRSLFGLGAPGPDRRLLDVGVKLLRHCLTLGASRSVGRQRCLVIRKTLADVLALTGRSRQSRALWAEVHKVDPACIEAALRVSGTEAAVKMLRRRALRSVGAGSGPDVDGVRRLGPGPAVGLGSDSGR